MPSSDGGTACDHACDVSATPALSCTATDTRYAAPALKALTADTGTRQNASTSVSDPALR